MKKIFTFCMMFVFGTTSTLSLQARDRTVSGHFLIRDMIPVVIDEQLHNQFQQFKSDIDGAKSQIARLKDQKEDILETFPGEAQAADIKKMAGAIDIQISEIENRRDRALVAIKPVEEEIEKIIKNAKGRPVVWRSIGGFPPNQVMIVTYSLNGEKIVSVVSYEKLKEDEKR
jgi:hypothetical protein